MGASRTIACGRRELARIGAPRLAAAPASNERKGTQRNLVSFTAGRVAAAVVSVNIRTFDYDRRLEMQAFHTRR
jgi:hypothetical protein